MQREARPRQRNSSARADAAQGAGQIVPRPDATWLSKELHRSHHCMRNANQTRPQANTPRFVCKMSQHQATIGRIKKTIFEDTGNTDEETRAGSPSPEDDNNEEGDKETKQRRRLLRRETARSSQNQEHERPKGRLAKYANERYHAPAAAVWRSAANVGAPEGDTSTAGALCTNGSSGDRYHGTRNTKYEQTCVEYIRVEWKHTPRQGETGQGRGQRYYETRREIAPRSRGIKRRKCRMLETTKKLEHTSDRRDTYEDSSNKPARGIQTKVNTSHQT